MNLYKEIIYRLRKKESERNIARDLGISRPTIHKYKIKAEVEGYLEESRSCQRQTNWDKDWGQRPNRPRHPAAWRAIVG